MDSTQEREFPCGECKGQGEISDCCGEELRLAHCLHCCSEYLQCTNCEYPCNSITCSECDGRGSRPLTSEEKQDLKDEELINKSEEQRGN